MVLFFSSQEYLILTGANGNCISLEDMQINTEINTVLGKHSKTTKKEIFSK